MTGNKKKEKKGGKKYNIDQKNTDSHGHQWIYSLVTQKYL